MYDIDVIAKAVRVAYLKHSGLPRPAWEELPEKRKFKWRKMAQAAIDAYIEEMP